MESSLKTSEGLECSIDSNRNWVVEMLAKNKPRHTNQDLSWRITDQIAKQTSHFILLEIGDLPVNLLDMDCIFEMDSRRANSYKLQTQQFTN